MDPVTDQVVIVDSGVWVDFFRGVQNWQTEWVLRELGGRSLGIFDLILCEVVQGIPKEADFARIQKMLQTLTVYGSGGEQAMLASARNYRLLRSKGITIRTTIDCIIATCCIQNGFWLLHKDRDFDPFETHLGLRVVRPDVVPAQ